MHFFAKSRKMLIKLNEVNEQRLLSIRHLLRGKEWQTNEICVVFLKVTFNRNTYKGNKYINIYL